MKKIYRIGADLIFALHFLVVLIVLFGWLKPEIWEVYMGVLIATLLSDILFGYCILSKFEFDLRKKINPENDYDYRWTSHYTHKLTNRHISYNFYKYFSLFFLISSIAINLYFGGH